VLYCYDLLVARCQHHIFAYLCTIVSQINVPLCVTQTLLHIVWCRNNKNGATGRLLAITYIQMLILPVVWSCSDCYIDCHWWFRTLLLWVSYATVVILDVVQISTSQQECVVAA